RVAHGLRRWLSGEIRPRPCGPTRAARPARPDPCGPTRAARPVRPDPCGPTRAAQPVRPPERAARPDRQPATVCAMTGYSGTPLARKLGIAAGYRVLLDGAPDAFALDGLPDGVALARRPGPGPYD